MLWKTIFLVGLGGGLGSIARFLCQKLMYERTPHPFPFGILIVNVSGCFLLGVFYALAEKGNLLTPEWRLLLTTGFCGGFTTFSTFAYDNINLLKNGDVIYFMLYTASSVILGILAAWLGILLFKLI